MGNTHYLEQSHKDAGIVKRVSLVILAGNIVLAALKTVFGAVFFNISVLSDAVHTLSDVGITLLVLLSAFISKPDEGKIFNYGREKIESLLVLFFSLILFCVGGLIVFEGVSGIIHPQDVSLNYYLLGVTVLSVLLKEAMFRYSIFYAKKIGSDALKADAWHHRSDALSSVAVLIGLAFGFFIKTDLAESIAALFVAGLIIKIAAGIFFNSAGSLLDRSAGEAVHDDLRKIIESTEGVVRVERLRTRLFGASIMVDAVICVSGDLTVNQSNKIAVLLQSTLENNETYRIKHCNICIIPDHSDAIDT